MLGIKSEAIHSLTEKRVPKLVCYHSSNSRVPRSNTLSIFPPKTPPALLNFLATEKNYDRQFRNIREISFPPIYEMQIITITYMGVGKSNFCAEA